MAAPVVVEGTQWGFLACYARQSERPWGSEEIAVLQAVAQMVAASIERSHKLRQRTKRREKLAELVEEIPEIFWAVDENTPKLLYASPSFERMWGCSRKEIASHPLGFLKHVHPEDRARAEGAFDLSSLRKEVSSREERLRVLHPDGVTRWISMRYSILLGEDKGTGLIMGLATDITEHKQQERRWLTQRESLIREVHHRIKNHLQGLVGLLRQHIQDAPELAPPMEAAISQISAVAAIHGLQAINKGSQIRLGETVSAICNNASKITRCPIHFDGVTLDAPLVIVESEAVPIALIINELVLNACKHRATSHAAIRVQVTANIPSKSAVLLICNEGARLHKGFDFAARKGLGTGLGLVKSLMPPLGAELTIEERNGGVEAQLKLHEPVLQWTA